MLSNKFELDHIFSASKFVLGVLLHNTADLYDLTPYDHISLVNTMYRSIMNKDIPITPLNLLQSFSTRDSICLSWGESGKYNVQVIVKGRYLLNQLS
jgi:hypothetical protein